MTGMPPPLATGRLTLLPYSVVTDAQLDELVAAWDDPEVWRYVGAGRDSFTRADLDSAMRRAGEHLRDELIVVRTGDGVVIGVCGLYPARLDGVETGEIELGYRFGRAFWGQGYGTEAASAVMRWAVEEQGVTSLVSDIQEPNIASRKIVERLGFAVREKRPMAVDPARVELWYAWQAPASS